MMPDARKYLAETIRMHGNGQYDGYPREGVQIVHNTKGTKSQRRIQKVQGKKCFKIQKVHYG